MVDFFYYHKKVTIICVGMGVIMASLFICYIMFKSEQIPIYYIVEENITTENHQATVSDGIYLYDVDYEKNELKNKRIPVTNTKVKAMDLRTESNTYELEENEASKYNGSVDDGLAYVNKLKLEGYSVSSLYRSNSHIDIVLHSESVDVRVIITSTGLVEIFAIDSGKNSIVPPYINEKEEGG